LLERTKYAALAIAVALLKQDAEELGGRRYERKTTGQGHRGRHEQTSVVVEGVRFAIHRSEIVRACRPMFVTISTEQTTEDDGFPSQHKSLFN
jgi:hypothetical protein